MATRGKHGKDVTVGPHKGDDRWEVRRRGNDRASVVTDNKADALKIGRRYAQEEHSELVVKGANGHIQSKDSHGHDPRRTKG